MHMFLKIQATKNQGVGPYNNKAGNQHITNQRNQSKKPSYEQLLKHKHKHTNKLLKPSSNIIIRKGTRPVKVFSPAD